MLDIRDADHEETSPTASTLVISRLACSLVGQTGTIEIRPGSIAYQSYGRSQAVEIFRCNFGLNPEFRGAIAENSLVVSGVDEGDDIRIIELRDHPFFVATLFVPQLTSGPGSPHPLIVAFLKATLQAAAQEESVKVPWRVT